jgi:uncharacterized surface protein with fasciclin (FAS1) repeats
MKTKILLLGSMLLLVPLLVRAAETRPAFAVAVSTARMHSFTEILRNSGLSEEALRTEDYTLIVPVDVSFYKLTSEQYKKLLSPAEKALAVKYVQSCMVKGRLTIDELAKGGYTTVSGIPLKVTGGAKPAVNGCPVFQSGIVGSKGIVHLIEGFLFTP